MMTASAAAFATLRNRWCEIVSGDDIHSIAKQIRNLLVIDLEFHTINQSRFLTQDAGVPQNGMIHGLLDLGFVGHQVLAIRRLVERGTSDETKRFIHSNSYCTRSRVSEQQSPARHMSAMMDCLI